MVVEGRRCGKEEVAVEGEGDERDERRWWWWWW